MRKHFVGSGFRTCKPCDSIACILSINATPVIEKVEEEEKQPCLPQPTDVPGVCLAVVNAANECDMTRSPTEGAISNGGKPPRPRVEYNMYSASEQLNIAQYATDHGVARAARHLAYI